MRTFLLPVVSAFASLACAVGLAVVAPACTVTTTPSVDPTSDAGPDAEVTCTPGVVWKASSARVEVSSFGFFQGSSGYDAKRADLSPAQLAALNGLCEIPTPKGPPGADFTSYQIRITDTDGTTATYRAAQDNLLDSDEGSGASSIPTLDINSLTPFLATFSCVSAKQEVPVDTDAGDAGPWSRAVTLPDDPSCIDGLFVQAGCDDVHMKLDIKEAGARHIALTSCFDNTRIRILAADGTTELVAGAAAIAPACASVDYTFTAAGTYDLIVEKTNAAGCDATSTAGDMAVRVERP